MKKFNTMKRVLLYSMLILFALSANAQQEPMVSQYMFNGLFLNPGYAGSHSYYTSTLLYRNQWVNFQGAPKTLLLSVDGPFHDEKMGLGMTVLHDEVGIVSQTDVAFNYSYNIPVAGGKLAFGLKGGLCNYSANYNQLVYWDQNDKVYDRGQDSRLLPKFGYGMFYHNDKFYAGISIPTLVAYDNNYKFNMDINKASFLRRHYFITAGYVFQASDDIKVKPTILMKYVANAPLEVDFNLMACFKDAIWAGFSYRTQDALIGMIEYQTNAKFRIGYAYDFTVTDLKQVSNGTHEILIGYDFGRDLTKVKTPRFY